MEEKLGFTLYSFRIYKILHVSHASPVTTTSGCPRVPFLSLTPPPFKVVRGSNGSRVGAFQGRIFCAAIQEGREHRCDDMYL